MSEGVAWIGDFGVAAVMIRTGCGDNRAIGVLDSCSYAVRVQVGGVLRHPIIDPFQGPREVNKFSAVFQDGDLGCSGVLWGSGRIPPSSYSHSATITMHGGVISAGGNHACRSLLRYGLGPAKCLHGLKSSSSSSSSSCRGWEILPGTLDLRRGAE